MGPPVDPLPPGATTDHIMQEAGCEEDLHAVWEGQASAGVCEEQKRGCTGCTNLYDGKLGPYQ